MKDLDPYVCIFENCKKEHQLFNSEDDWFNHIQWQHTLQWSCLAPGHEGHIFYSEVDLEQHIRLEHAGSFTESQLKVLISKSAKPSSDTFHMCPLCNDDLSVLKPRTDSHSPTGTTAATLPQNFRYHITHHLEMLALLSLPERACLDEFLSNERPSQSADLGTLRAREAYPATDFHNDPEDFNLVAISVSDKDIPDADIDWTPIQQELQRRCKPHPTPSRDTMLKPFLVQPQQPLFIRALCDIPKQDYDNIYKVLRWLTGSLRDMTVEELAEVVAIDEPQVAAPGSHLPILKDIIKRCPTLIKTHALDADDVPKVDVDDDPKAAGRLAVRLAHDSVREFLLSEDIQQSLAHRYSINETKSHAFIAESCLTYLSCLDKELFVTEDYDHFPLVHYAASFWPSHMLKSNQNPSVIRQGAEFLKDRGYKFRHWASLYDRSYVQRGLASPIYYASEAGLAVILMVLLGEGQPIDEEYFSNGGRGSPLLAASWYGHEDVVGILLRNGAHVNAKDIDGQTALAKAVGHEATVMMLLDHGADIDAKDKYEESALHTAAHKDHRATVKMLLDHGADIDAKDKSGGTALHTAAYDGHTATIRILLDHGADINARNELSRTALQTAVRQRDVATVKMLLDYGADIDAKDISRGTALYIAIDNGDTATVKMLLDYGADIKAKDDSRGTALHTAACYGHAAIVKILVDYGADINAEDKLERTALQTVVRRRDAATVKMLLDYGADVNAKDRFSRTALQEAVERGNETVVRMLLDYDADVNAKDRLGKTALQEAAERGNETIVKMLLDCGAAINAMDHLGKAALQEAAKRGNETIVKMLLDCGATIDAKDHLGKTALQEAAERGNETVVEILLDYGADVNPEAGLLQPALQPETKTMELLSHYSTRRPTSMQ